MYWPGSVRIHGVDPCVGVADRHRVREDLLQPIIGVELLALHDPDRAELSCQFGVEPAVGLLLDDLVHHVEEADVVGHDRVVARQARHVLELHLRRVVLLGQWVHLEVLLDVVRCLLDVVGILHVAPHVSAHEVPHAVRLRPHDVVPVGHVAVVARREHEILAALAVVGAGCAHVAHVAEVHVIENAEHVRWDVDDGGTVLFEVEEAPRVQRGVVPGEDEWLGVAELFRDQDLVALGQAQVPMTLSE